MIPDSALFTVAERDTLYSVLHARRDMRHFLPNSHIDELVLDRLLQAAHSAPSVGLMQPWRFIRVRATPLRQQVMAIVEAERLATARAMAERDAEFMRLKVEGIRECAELFAVVLAPDDGTVFGRRTMPQEMALCSAACAIQNLWLAARAENLGMGWVSLFDPQQLADLLSCPPGAKPIALLCMGPVHEFYPRPMLEQLDWRHGKALSSVLMQDSWQGEQP
ncbi:MAG TPA: 5,6-dimethylbenzimidazole synthase [Gallionellaceae bacterium]|nr:5,6-dimethylbenzimidazole synthase [Gallionellaceae bacterium]